MTRTVKALRTAALAAVLALAGASASQAKDIQGGVTLDQAPVSDAILYPTVDGSVAKLQDDGTAAAPSLAPDGRQEGDLGREQADRQALQVGGGHGKWNDTGYDCSGTVSFALKGGSLLDTPCWTPLPS